MDIRDADECLWDEVSLGEVMLRMDPGGGRVRSARSFTVWEGGGEYNVARGLRRAFGKRTAIVTALVENEVGRLVEDLMLQGGVDLRYGPVDFCVPDHSNSCRCVTFAFVSPKSRTLNTCCAVGTGSV